MYFNHFYLPVFERGFTTNRRPLRCPHRPRPRRPRLRRWPPGTAGIRTRGRSCLTRPP